MQNAFLMTRERTRQAEHTPGSDAALACPGSLTSRQLGSQEWLSMDAVMKSSLPMSSCARCRLCLPSDWLPCCGSAVSLVSARHGLSMGDSAAACGLSSAPWLSCSGSPVASCSHCSSPMCKWCILGPASSELFLTSSSSLGDSALLSLPLVSSAFGGASGHSGTTLDSATGLGVCLCC